MFENFFNDSEIIIKKPRKMTQPLPTNLFEVPRNVLIHCIY